MLRLSKKVEYSLLAMQVMASKPEIVISSKDVSQAFGISPALIAKVLQALVHAGLVRSYHGMRGGYQLARDAKTISVADVINAIEGCEAAIVECQGDHHDSCDVMSICTIRKPLSILQQRINSTFASMTVAELAAPTNHHVSLTLS